MDELEQIPEDNEFQGLTESEKIVHKILEVSSHFTMC